MPLSDKQLAVREAIQDSRIVIATGPIRSGKTASAFVFFLEWATRNHKNKDFGVSCHTDSQFKNVILKTAEEWLGNTIPLVRKDDGWHFGNGNKLVKFIGNNIGSVAKVRGYTFAGAFVDEYVKQPQDFVSELFGRCSVPGAKFVMTCNPEGPLHWGKVEWIDKINDPKSELNGSVIPFELTDNPILPEEYIRNIKEQLRGTVMYKRLIDGLWVSATGAIYPFVEKNLQKTPDEVPWKVGVAVDVASATVTHALLMGHYSKGRTFVMDEWRHNGAMDGQILVDTQVRRILKWVRASAVTPTLWVLDPSANDFQLNLAQYVGKGKVLHGINDVLVGIQSVDMALGANRLKIDPKCKHLIKEMANYIWDEKAAEGGQDKPFKNDDHGPDALRYYVHTTQIMDSYGSKRRRVRAA